jgi:G protein-coupled receptor Mth (Methuselah protein)
VSIENDNTRLATFSHLSICRSFVYNAHYNDSLFIIQNGSLLSVGSGSNYFQVFNDYCVEYDTEEGVMTAFVWDVWLDPGVTVSRAEVLIMAVCMFASVVFLGATIFIYSSIRELRDLHGKSLICHASFLLSGYVLLVIVNLFDIQSKRIGYFIQFAILSCFFWMLVMCIDLCLHTWYYLPRGKRVVEEIEKFHFAVYGAMAVIIPLVLVILTLANGIPGMPSYYLKATSSKLESKYCVRPLVVWWCSH